MVKLQRISVMPLAKIMCVLQGVIGLILGVIVTIGSLIYTPEEGIWSIGAWALLLFPVVNSVLGLFAGTFLAWMYNLLSQWLGGIEFEIKEQKL